MSETPRQGNPEISKTPSSESAEGFSLSKLLECVNELAPKDYEYLESLINDGALEADDAAKVLGAVEALRDIKDSEDKVGTLKKYVPVLVDLVYARDALDGLARDTAINRTLVSAVYDLVDAVYAVAPADFSVLAERAAVKIDEDRAAAEE